MKRILEVVFLASAFAVNVYATSAQPADAMKKDVAKKNAAVNWPKLLAETRERFAGSQQATLNQTRLDRAYFELNPDDPDAPPFLVFKGVCLQTAHDDEEKMKDVLAKELAKFPAPNIKFVVKIDEIKFYESPIYKLQEAAVSAFKADATFNNFFERATYGPDGALRLHVLCLRYDNATNSKLDKLLKANPVGNELTQTPDAKTKSPTLVRRDYDWLGNRLALQRKFAADGDLFLARTRLNDGYLHYSKDHKTVHFNVSGVCIHPPGLVAAAEREKRWKARVSNLFPGVVYEPTIADIAMVANPSIAWQNELAADEKNDGVFLDLGQFDAEGRLTWVVKLPSELWRAGVLKVLAAKPAPAVLAPVDEKNMKFQYWQWEEVLPRGQGRLAEGDFLLHRARLDRVFLKYDDSNLGDPYLHIDGVALHPVEVVPADKQRQAFEKALVNLLPSAMTHKWNSAAMRFRVSPIYPLQSEAAARNMQGMLFADGRYDRDGKLHLSIAIASEVQQETAIDIVKSTPIAPGIIGPRDDKTAPKLDFNLLPWDEMFEQMQMWLARDNDTLLRKTRVDRGYFSYPASKIGPDLTLTAVGIFPKQDETTARLKARFGSFIDLYLLDRLQAGPIHAIPAVQHVENPAPILQAKIAAEPTFDGIRLDDASFNAVGKLVFHGMWVSKDQRPMLEELVRETLTADHPALKRGIHWGAMQDFDSPGLLHQMRVWVADQEDINETWLERFYFDAAGTVRVSGFTTRVPDKDKTVRKLPDFLPKFASQALPPIKTKDEGGKMKEDGKEKEVQVHPSSFILYPSFAQEQPKDDGPIKLDLVPNIAQHLRDNIPKVVACDGLRIDRCFYDPQGVFRIEGLADHAKHTEELTRFLDDEMAPFNRKRQLAKGWKEGRQTVIPLRPMMVSLDENLPSLPEFDGVTFRRAHHDPKNQLVLTASAIGDADVKEMTPILKKLLETHPRWRLRTTFGLVIDISDRKKADRDLAKKHIYSALHLLQVNIGEASVVELPDVNAGWWSHAWPFDAKLKRVRPTDDDYDRVLQHTDAALLHDPANVLARYLRGYVLQTKGRSDLSLRDYRRMVTYELDDPELRHKRILDLELVQGSLRQSAFRIEQEAILQVSEGWTLRELRERPAARDTTK